MMRSLVRHTVFAFAVIAIAVFLSACASSKHKPKGPDYPFDQLLDTVTEEPPHVLRN